MPYTELDENWLKERVLACWRRGGEDWPVKVVSVSKALEDDKDLGTVYGCIGRIGDVLGKTPLEIATAFGLPLDDYRQGAFVLVLGSLPTSPSQFKLAGLTQTPNGETYDEARHDPFYPGKGYGQWILKSPIVVSHRFKVNPGAPFDISLDLLRPEELPADARLASVGGFSADHPEPELLPVLVATATKNEKNTIRMELIPIACWKLNDFRFDGGLSFVRPEAQREMAILAALVKDKPGAPLSVFGHADPIGCGEENKLLSGRRAAAVYALLTRAIAIWEDLFSKPAHTDNWGLTSIQIMLDAIGYSPGLISGVDGPDTRTALLRFQSASDLSETCRWDKPTRAALFTAYMDFLCGSEFRLKPSDFLARGADPGGRGDYQGCGEHNPVLLASAEQAEEFLQPANKAIRDSFYSPNRRVVVLLFRPDSVVTPRKWPCPGAMEGVAACHRTFWANHTSRLACGPSTRRYEESFDTYGCRFYDRIAGESPCESLTPLRPFRVILQDEQGNAISREKYSLEIDGKVITDKFDLTDSSGMLEQLVELNAQCGILRFRHHIWKLTLSYPPAVHSKKGALIRIANLGFLHEPVAPPEEEDYRFALRTLQGPGAVASSGLLDAAAVNQIQKLHEDATAVSLAKRLSHLVGVGN